MTRHTPAVPRAAAVATAVLSLAAIAPAPAAAQTTGPETLLQSVENCLAWMNNGFPDRTPFAGGFEVIQPFGEGGTGIYREEQTGFEITLTVEGDTATCESTQGTIALGEDGLDNLERQLAHRINAGRAVQIAPDRYSFCAGPAGLLTVTEAEGGGATFLMEFNTGAALAEAGSCGG